MQFDIGEKFVLKENKSLGEIVSRYPAGSRGLPDPHYDLVYEGVPINISEPNLLRLFRHIPALNGDIKGAALEYLMDLEPSQESEQDSQNVKTDKKHKAVKRG